MSAEVGKIVLASRVVDLGALGGHTVELSAVLPRPLSACEVRLYCEPEVRADISAIEIELDWEGLKRFRKLNFGCGYDKREDYLNIDTDPACSPDLLIQDNDFSMVPKNHFEEILAWDVLEHIPRAKTLSALLDWAEFLRMNGKLILQTSSILGVARLLDQTNSYADHHNYTIYLYGNQAHAGDFHLTGFTETTLRVHLEAAGFETDVITTRYHWLFFTEARKTYDWTELATLRPVLGNPAAVVCPHRSPPGGYDHSPWPTRAAQGLEVATRRTLRTPRRVPGRPHVPRRPKRTLPGRTTAQCQCGPEGCLDSARRCRRRGRDFH
jgi:predicted SAM-dependent methyltransferase